MGAFDPRVTPARADLAAKELEGKVAAARFVEGRVMEVIEPQAPLRHAPRPDAPLATEALKGERVTIYDVNAEGFSWGQLAADNYVGWLPSNALAPAGAAPTHKVAALRTFAFPGPSIKLPPIEALPFGAALAVTRIANRMAVTPNGAHVSAAHLKPIGEYESDFVAVAERFLGVPYLWGGKTALGLDCSGLVQIALTACGMACPRDSDMQEAALGALLPAAIEHDAAQRGDLVFWQGHVAIVRDHASLVHANAFHMAVAIEPLGEAVARIRAAWSEVTAVRRIIAS
ncbi:MAG TPA: NlpC/P60 family protein [Xanthobacteraceae bacterium]|jgi:cell wall-associated NlpC family hydrolase|nr:NlpC/P60 family protein [Xanthobacteraceae bacterium]